MVNFCEDCPPKIIEPYLDSLVNGLESVLSSKLEEVSALFRSFLLVFLHNRFSVDFYKCCSFNLIDRFAVHQLILNNSKQ